MTYLEKITDLQHKIENGQMMEGFEHYYHDDVQVIEASGEVRQGKAAQREAIKGWQGSIKEWHASGLGAITSDEKNGVTTVESWFDATFQDGNRMKMEEVGVQHWEGDQIVKERFYYNIPDMPAS